MKGKSKQLGLTAKITIGLILGLIVGVILHSFVPSSFIRDEVIINGIFLVFGEGFIRAMQMLVVPLVFSSLVVGTMSMGDTKKLGKIGIKTLGFYIVTTSLAILLALVIATILRPGIGMNLIHNQEAAKEMIKESPSFAQILLNIIPKNPIKAFTDGEMLQIIFFAVIVGVICTRLNDMTTGFNNVISDVNEIMMDMTTIVMKFAPIGVFCLIAKTFSGLGFSAIYQLIVYVLAVLLALFVHAFGVYTTILKLLSGLSPIKFLKKFTTVIAFAFSTASSNASVPLNINTLNSMGISRKISSFTIPLGATINMDGTAIMQGCAVVFIANAYGVVLTPSDYLMVIATATLASIGTAGVPSVGLVTLSMVLTSVGLPVEGIAMILGIDRILDMVRTAVNITGDAICTTIIAKQNNMVDIEKYNS